MSKVTKRVAGSWIYIPLADRELPEAEQTQYVLEPLNGAQREYVADNSWRVVTTGDGSVERVTRMRTVAREVFLTNVAEIRNFPTGAAEPWPREREARETYAERLDDDLVYEIGNEIFIRSKLGPEEAKQVGESSAPAPTSS